MPLLNQHCRVNKKVFAKWPEYQIIHLSPFPMLVYHWQNATFFPESSSFIAHHVLQQTF